MTSALDRARRAIASGDALMAYDAAVAACDADPEDLEARYLVALALARAGATERALEAERDLATRASAMDHVEPGMLEDVQALQARIAKDVALQSTGPQRAQLLRAAGGKYAKVADATGGYYSAINAATLALLAGDGDIAASRAREARTLARAALPARAEDGYWQAATLAEAALILEDSTALQDALRDAAACAPNAVSLAVARRQLRLLCATRTVDEAVLEMLQPATVVHYTGHRVGPRFPASSEAAVTQAVRAYFSTHPIGVVYGALAGGADVIAAEAALDCGAELHVVLPFETGEFEAVSVAPCGPGWTDRFRRCLAAATSVIHATDSAFGGDTSLFGYAGWVAMGHALVRAAMLDASVEQLAVWDGRAGPSDSGTGHDVRTWSRAGGRTHIVALPVAEPPPADEARTASREVAAVLFTDIHGFSNLRDEHFPIFLREVSQRLVEAMDAFGAAVRWRNSWGDAIQVVFSDVTAAAHCALQMQDQFRAVDLAYVGLPPRSGLRIGGHAGPMRRITDPVTGIAGYWGRELTRAARIEPRTPLGEVYVTDAFAALLALNPQSGLRTEYMGRVTTAKDFETIPMYRLRRAGSPSDGGGR